MLPAGDFHISFSAGITKHNIADAVRCNMKPITSCTDLLTTSGYMRMYDYFVTIKQEMKKNNSYDINQFVISSADDINISDVNIAGVTNADDIIPKLIDNPRYHYVMNQKDPPKIDSHLVIFDCITCNKCLPVCPNASNFSIATGKEDFSFTNYKISDGKLIPTNRIPSGSIAIPVGTAPGGNPLLGISTSGPISASVPVKTS